MAKRVEKYPEIVYRKHPKPLSPHPSPWVRRPERHLSLFLFLVCVSCSVITVDVRYGFAWITDLAGKAAAPVIYTVDLIFSPVSQSAGVLRETITARQENDELRRKLADLERKLDRYEKAYHENLRLRRLLDLKAEIAPEAMAAEVLRYENSAARKIMRLRGGRENGFTVGQPVLTQAGQLLGRIVRVTDRVSTVSLITDPTCRIAVSVERTQAQGILYTRFGELFVRLDRTEIVSEGDRILTSHLSARYPKGLVVGTLGKEVGPDQSDPMVAVELGLMKGYRVHPVFPVEKWGEINEVLCLPVFETRTAELAEETAP